MRRALPFLVPVLALAGGLALWLSSRMRTAPLPPLTPPWTEPGWIDAGLRVQEGPDGFGFVVSGTTRLPPGTVLRARVYAVELMDDARSGVREDEEPLVWGDDEDDPRQPPFRSFRAGTGAFSLEVCRFPRRPYSLLYRARLSYRAEDQDPEVRLLLGDEEMSVAVDFRLGSDPALVAELRERHARARTDLEDLEGMFREVRLEAAGQRESPDPEAWRARAWAWELRLDSFLERNRERFSLWAVFHERRAKMRLGGVAGLLRRLIDEGAVGSDDRESGLSEYLEETWDELGFEGGLDPAVFGPLFARYERALDGLPVGRGEALTALLHCAPPLSRRRRAYAALNDVGFRLARLLESPGTGTRTDHDRALSEFKSLAGLD